MLGSFCEALKSAVDSNPDRAEALVLEREDLVPLLAEVRERLHLVVEPLLRPVALLQGICLTLLRRHYDHLSESVRLEYGDPFPIPVRQRGNGAPRMTPHPKTIGLHELTERAAGFRVHRVPANDPLQVELDYSRRGLDRITWDFSETADRVDGAPPSWGPVAAASLHPYTDWDVDFDWAPEPKRDRWFWVRPKSFEADAILRNLRLAVAEEPAARIAVLPELTLPVPDALEEDIRAAPAEYPPLIVAGSAHVEETVDGETVRGNVSITYMRGARLLVTRKYQPLALPEYGEEDLTPGSPHILRLPSDVHTRLGVAICADLQNPRLVQLFTSMGVNLLIVPSMTPVEGTFPAALAGPVGYCQAIGILANVVPPKPERPFLVMLGRPFGGAGDQVSQHPAEVESWQARAQIYPWQPKTADAVVLRDWV